MAPPLTVAPPSLEPAAYEQANVHAVYNLIATHFSATRFKPWPVIAQFLSSIPPGSLGFDAGCGNGKYLPAWDHLDGRAMMVGLDRSDNLASLARRVGFIKEGEENLDDGRRREVMVGDVLDAGGLRPGIMDFAISIATLHHLSTPERRLQTVQSLLRVISPTQGRAMIFVWALEQGDAARRIVPSRVAPDIETAQNVTSKAQDVFVPWVLSKQAPKTVKDALKGPQGPGKKKSGGKRGVQPRSGPADTRSGPSTPPDEPDLETSAGGALPLDLASAQPSAPRSPSPLPSPPRVYQRYYHLFREGELPALVRQACAADGLTLLEPGSPPVAEGERWLRIVQDGYDRDNWYVEVRRGTGPEQELSLEV